MKLYDSLSTPVCRPIRMLAHELDIPLEFQLLDYSKNETKSPEFLKVNPNGRIPVLQDGEMILWESGAILNYLAGQRPERGLLPTDLKARADVDRWLFWRASHLHPAMMKVVYERVLKAKYGLGPMDEKVLAQGLAEVEEFCTVLDHELAGREYLANNKLSVADFFVVGSFQLRVPGNIDLSKWKNLTAWIARMESRPSWAATAR